MIAEEKPDFPVFFRYPVAWNVLIACNRTAADFILTSVLMKEDYPAVVPDFTGYLERQLSS